MNIQFNFVQTQEGKVVLFIWNFHMTRHFKSFTFPSIEAFQNLIRSLLMVTIHLCSTRIASLVYSMRTENIDSVMCNGRWIMRGKIILTVDEVLFPLFCSYIFWEIVTSSNIVSCLAKNLPWLLQGICADSCKRSCYSAIEASKDRHSK